MSVYTAISYMYVMYGHHKHTMLTINGTLDANEVTLGDLKTPCCSPEWIILTLHVRYFTKRTANTGGHLVEYMYLFKEQYYVVTIL
jgi:hypothetical protein